jgi:hypothetical protein
MAECGVPQPAWNTFAEADIHPDTFPLAECALVNPDARPGQRIYTLPLARVSGEEGRRQEIIQELLCTEAAYLADLRRVTHHFLHHPPAPSPLGAREHRCLWGGVEQFLPLHEELHGALAHQRAQGGVVLRVGSPLLRVLPHMRLYTLYCAGFGEAMRYLAQARREVRGLEEWVARCAGAAQCRGLDVSALLLKPIQRVCKYPLFLQVGRRCCVVLGWARGSSNEQVHMPAHAHAHPTATAGAHAPGAPGSRRPPRGRQRHALHPHLHQPPAAQPRPPAAASVPPRTAGVWPGAPL